MMSRLPTGRSVDVLAVGNALVDLTFHVDKTLIERHGLPLGDMLLCDAERAKPVLADVGPAVHVTYGGTACNTAGGIAALGGRAAFIGKIAEDAAGGLLRRALAASAIRFDGASLATGPATAACLILVTPDGQRTGVTHLGACGELAPADIREDRIAESRLVFTEAYLLDRPSSARAFHALVETARKTRTPVAMTLADPHCVARHRAPLRQAIQDQSVDMLFANEAEVLALAGTGDLPTALGLLCQSLPLVAVTRGARGSIVAEGQDRHDIPASPAAIVDTTGAGDLYAAGVTMGLLSGLSPKQAGQLGADVAAEAVSHFTARPLVSLKPFLRRRLAGGLTNV